MKKLLIVLAVLLLAGASVAGVQQTRLLEVMLANVQILDDYKLYFGTGSDASIEYDEDGTDQLRITGSTIFEDAVAFDSALTFTGGYSVPDDVAITFGTGLDGSIEYDENGTDQLRFTGATIFEDAVDFSAAVGLAAATTVADDIAFCFGADLDACLSYDELTDDRMEATGSWSFASEASFEGGVSLKGDGFIADDMVWTFGDNDDATMGYDELTNDAFEITCAAITMTGAVGVTGAVVGTSTITSSATGSLGWSIVAGANTACNTTCTFACAAGQDADAANVLVACDNAAADLCICAGAN